MLFSAFLISTLLAENTLEDLDQLRWQNRIVVLNEMNNLTEILNLLKNNQAEIEARHILWFVLAKDDTFSNFNGGFNKSFAKQLRAEYTLRTGQVILIGKDGGLKSSYADINLNAIFADIDVMPMRRREMQQ